jgi:hypothetical protein
MLIWRKTMKKNVIYWISTSLLSAQMVMAASMYLLKNDMVSGVFVVLGFPTYLIYPMALAKILGVVAILTNKSKTLTEWAYAGFFYNFLLAISAHISAGDGDSIPAVVSLALLITSYVTYRKTRTT